MLIGLSSPDNRYSQEFLTNYAIINLQDELTRVPGVSRVQVFGGQYALRVWVKPDLLAKLGVTATDVINAIQTQNNVNPAGQIGGEPIPAGQQFTYTVRTQGRLVTPEEFGNIIIRANPDGSVLHLRDVARVELGAQSLQPLSALQQRARRHDGGLSAARLQRRAKRARLVTKRIKELSGDFPAGMRYDIPLDTTKAVTAGIHEIVITLGHRAAARRARRLPLPAELARDADSADGGAGFAHRHLHRLSARSASPSTRSPSSDWSSPSAWSWTTPSWWSRRWSTTSKKA